MLAFVAHHLVRIRDDLNEMVEGDKANLFLRRAGVFSVDGAISSGINLDKVIGDARTDFHTAVDAFAGEKSMTRLAMRSAEDNQKLHERTITALRAYAKALENAKPNHMARETQDTSEVDAPEI